MSQQMHKTNSIDFNRVGLAEKWNNAMENQAECFHVQMHENKKLSELSKCVYRFLSGIRTKGRVVELHHDALVSGLHNY